MGLRRVVARHEGADEALIASAVGDRTGLTERQRAALAVADAYLTGRPGRGRDDLVPAGSLDLAEVAEILLRLTVFSRNKVRVCLGLDEDEITIRDY